MEPKFNIHEEKAFLLAREAKEKQQQEIACNVMDHYAILLSYFDKQLHLIHNLYDEIITINVDVYDKRYTFALKTQQFHTALEDLFKQIAKSFENHIEKLDSFQKELLVRMNLDIPKMRPAVISTKSLLLLDKIRSFRHFIRHAYDVELDAKELSDIQQKMIGEFSLIFSDLEQFRRFIQELIDR